MSLSLYDVSIPVFIRAFGNLSEILKKGEAFADEKGLTHQELLEARLIGDMYPLTGQIQRASDSAKFAAVRVAGIENVPMADEEASFAELHARIEKTVALLKSIPQNAMDDKEGMEVVLKTHSGPVEFTGKSYILNFAIPNFFFHVTTAYAILRHKGVPVGKMDYLGRR
ncbi:DUF1993 domain-containing protein [Rhizobium sp. LC145]|uniref:DUF1993 domain-containing protein n=1 Tax=Rhizobium sp. LC145 TaxID=1120688 RepID=UPI000629EB84|nr:DUF1993 domain-containing protein [Rhizobium sp. LC145]KKX32039.1 hypothetical protein YH62_08800 [Rhizobium sp. LC145]TKT66812.1 DUF1993 domain-containing protein [Rhizobiaceae bacterium LC148]